MIFSVCASLYGQENTITRDTSITNVTDFSITPRYPNPFSPVSKLFFSIPDSSFVNLTYCDSNGRKVITFYNDILTEGKYIIDWNFMDSSGVMIPSGIYYMRLQARVLKDDRYYLPIDINQKYIIVR